MKNKSTSEPKLNKIYNNDCISAMQHYNKPFIDLVITDPPFGIDFNNVNKVYGRNDDLVLKGYNEVLPSDYLDFSNKWISNLYPLLKDDSSVYIFSGWNNLKDILIAADNNGLKLINHIIWQYEFGVYTKKKYVSSHYHLLYYCKNPKLRRFYTNNRFSDKIKDNNNRSLLYNDLQDVWKIKREYWTGIKTPTKLPREIIDKILGYSSIDNDLVFDPFVGSGQVPVVSVLNNRRFLGYEIVKEYYEFANTRIKHAIGGEYIKGLKKRNEK